MRWVVLTVVDRGGAAAQPNHAGELGRRVAREHGHEHSVGRVERMDVAAGAPVGSRAVERVTPAVGALSVPHGAARER